MEQSKNNNNNNCHLLIIYCMSDFVLSNILFNPHKNLMRHVTLSATFQYKRNLRLREMQKPETFLPVVSTLALELFLSSTFIYHKNNSNSHQKKGYISVM